MEALIAKQMILMIVLPADDDIGKNTKINDADGRYIEFVKATFPRKLSLEKSDNCFGLCQRSRL